MKKSILATIILLVLGLNITTINLSSASAIGTEWYVTCNYDENGNLTSVRCENEGDDNCYDCPGSILVED